MTLVICRLYQKGTLRDTGSLWTKTKQDMGMCKLYNFEKSEDANIKPIKLIVGENRSLRPKP